MTFNNREYYNNNKERILNKMYEKQTCDICNCTVNHCGFARHCRSSKHLKKAKLLEEIQNMDIDSLKKKLLTLHK